MHLMHFLCSNTLRVVDARPLVNAMFNSVKGSGYESTANYLSVSAVTHQGIGNVHAQTAALRKLQQSIHSYHRQESAFVDASLWLEQVSLVLAAAVSIVRDIVAGTSCVVHCSDGWDRTPQLTALAQLMLDPYYRTMTGFAVLVEKVAVSFIFFI